MGRAELLGVALPTQPPSRPSPTPNDFTLLPCSRWAQTIKDPKATKPDDWDEREQIPDPEDKKPEGWDDIPATLPDKDAKKPEDWDDEEDGERGAGLFGQGGIRVAVGEVALRWRCTRALPRRHVGAARAAQPRLQGRVEAQDD